MNDDTKDAVQTAAVGAWAAIAGICVLVFLIGLGSLLWAFLFDVVLR